MSSARLPADAVARRVSAAGNSFLLVDAIAGPAPAAPAELARAVCAGELDGLLLLDRDGGVLRMVVYNADGSRPETCGNGLRCVALWAVRAGHVAEGVFRIVTDAGARSARVVDGVAAVSMGRAEVGDERAVALGPRESVLATPVDVGNPHLVVPRPRIDDAEMERLGAPLAGHATFPAGVNVELVRPAADDAGRIHARVWERGVGETLACGSGACAVAAWAVARGVARWPVSVRLPGGTLAVDARDGELWLTGPVDLDGPDVARTDVERAARARRPPGELP